MDFNSWTITKSNLCMMGTLNQLEITPFNCQGFKNRNYDYFNISHQYFVMVAPPSIFLLFSKMKPNITIIALSAIGRVF